MSLTAIVFLAVFGVGAILTLYNPFYGVLLYIFEWHNHPPYMWWGDEVPDLRWAYSIAMLTLASLIINRKRLAELIQPNFKPIIWLILLVINNYVVTFLFALDPEQSAEKALEWFKIAVNFFIMVQVIRTYKDYRIMIILLILMVGNFGRMAWEVGSNRTLGFSAPNAGSENQIASHVVAMLPFVGVYFLKDKPWVKVLTVLVMPFALNLLVLANSRGAMVGAFAVGLFSLLSLKGKWRFIVAICLIFGALLFLRLSNQQFWERQETTTEYEEEHSAMSRIYIWQGALRMLVDHPFGVGGEAFDDLSMQYAPELRKPKTQHNTFIAVATDWGIIGIILYSGLLIHTFVILRRIKQISLKIPILSKYFLEATALQLALIGILVAGITHSRQYAEVIYWLCAFAVSLYNIQKAELEKIQEDSKEEIPKHIEEKVPAVH